jgi:hypothetical protein
MKTATRNAGHWVDEGLRTTFVGLGWILERRRSRDRCIGGVRAGSR